MLTVGGPVSSHAHFYFFFFPRLKQRKGKSASKKYRSAKRLFLSRSLFRKTVLQRLGSIIAPPKKKKQDRRDQPTLTRTKFSCQQNQQPNKQLKKKRASHKKCRWEDVRVRIKEEGGKPKPCSLQPKRRTAPPRDGRIARKLRNA